MIFQLYVYVSQEIPSQITPNQTKHKGSSCFITFFFCKDLFSSTEETEETKEREKQGKQREEPEEQAPKILPRVQLDGWSSNPFENDCC
jgi:hypothetical protein